MTTGILLISPKFPHNIGGAVRALSCFGGGEVAFSGNRVDLGDRLPREERMKAYGDTPWRQIPDEETYRPVSSMLARMPNLTPVAVELLPGTEMLHTFEHPEDALYIFGPEDGSLPNGVRRACHRFVAIPSLHCLNLAAAVYIVLYDRAVKRWQAGLEEMPSIDGEGRGWWHSPALESSL